MEQIGNRFFLRAEGGVLQEVETVQSGYLRIPRPPVGAHLSIPNVIVSPEPEGSSTAAEKNEDTVNVTNNVSSPSD